MSIIKPGSLVMLVVDHPHLSGRGNYGIVICQHRLKLKNMYWKVLVGNITLMLSEDEIIPIYNNHL